MKNINRKHFLQSSAVLLAAAVTGLSFDARDKKMLLSFSTLGCPDWSFKETVDFAVLSYGELRENLTC